MRLKVALNLCPPNYVLQTGFILFRRRIFDWMRQIPKLEELIAKGHMKKMTGRGPKNRDIDQVLILRTVFIRHLYQKVSTFYH